MATQETASDIGKAEHGTVERGAHAWGAVAAPTVFIIIHSTWHAKVVVVVGRRARGALRGKRWTGSS